MSVEEELRGRKGAILAVIDGVAIRVWRR